MSRLQCLTSRRSSPGTSPRHGQRGHLWSSWVNRVPASPSSPRSWQLSRFGCGYSEPARLPVVLLDGFDELVQAAAVNRYDYLEQVRDFQHRQAQIGHPVVVIVTSRTVVADQARFPASSLALQLQPFTEPQVRQWLEIWGRRNSSLLAGRDL